MKQKKREIKLTKSKKLFFNIILISLPIVLLLILEIFLRLFHYGDNMKVFIDYPGAEKLKHKIINPEIGKKYFSKIDYSTPCHDMFLKEKPENGFRIFVMGSSTVQGFPYDENLMFTRILQERLQDSYPDKYIEVINTSLTAVNSFTLLDFIDDILDEKPDAILIYAGHNEFYGALGSGSVEKSNQVRGITLLHLDLLSSKVYQLLRNFIQSFLSDGENKNKVSGTLMKVIANNKEIPYKGKVYNKGIKNYKKNMGQLLKKTQKKGIPVFYSEMVSNVKDLHPFCSSPAIGFSTSDEAFIEAKQFYDQEHFEKAREKYYQAKDLDCIRFRASEEINELIHSLSRQYNSYIVPMKTSFFEEASPNKLIGNNLITEHVHPNIDGYFLMADAFFYSLAESKLLGDKLNIVYYKNPAYYKRNWGYTKIDSLYGVHGVNTLMHHWPFQPYDAPFTDYTKIYKPVTLEDSLAIDVVKNKFKIHVAHEKMGEHYKKKGDYYNAFREFYAAISCNPYQIKNYLKAVECLFETHDMNTALKLIEKSLTIQETHYAFYKKGEILIKKSDYQEAIEALNKAKQLDKNNEIHTQILTRLYEANFYLGNTQKYSEIFNELKKINPEFQMNVEVNKTEYVYYVPVQVESQIKHGLELFNKRKDEEALQVLLNTLEIKETSLANRIVGELLLSRNDRNSIVYFLKAYEDYKKDKDFLYKLGMLYLQNGAKNKAFDTLEELKKIDENSKYIPLLEERIKEN